MFGHPGFCAMSLPLAGRWAFTPRLFPSAPAARLGTLRFLIGLYAFVFLSIRAPHYWSYSAMHPEQFQPVGLGTLLSGILPAPVVQILVVSSVLLSVPFMLGYRFRIFGPLFASALMVLLTYSNCFGQILHTEHLLALHVLVLALAPAADAVSKDAIAREHAARRSSAVPEFAISNPATPHPRYGWAIQLLSIVCVAGYLLAGIAKVRHSGLEFVMGDTLRNYVAFDNVRKLELGSIGSPVGPVLLQHTGLFGMLAGLSLGLELGAPLALVHRGFGMLWTLLVWGFHLGVLVIMAIGFPYHLSFIAFLSFYRAEAILGWRPLDALLSRLGLIPQAGPEPHP